MKFILCVVFGAVVTTSTYADSSSSSGSTNCPFECSDLFQPVCGSDGVTYSNECHLNLWDCENGGHTVVAHVGKCFSSTDTSGSQGCSADACSLIVRPVCGSDGKTYGNDCLLGVATCKSDGAITKVSDGDCPGESQVGSGSGCSQVCFEVFRPVCGSDGHTYPNSCFLTRAACQDPSITLAHNGACEGTSLSTEGSSDNSTSTESSQETTTTGSETSSSQSASCPSICPAIYASVCGSDGVTYGNECKLEVASCNHPELCLKKASDGACAPVECKVH